MNSERLKHEIVQTAIEKGWTEYLPKVWQSKKGRPRWEARLAAWLHWHGFKRASWLVADLSIWIQRKRIRVARLKPPSSRG
jgi:hypothetical protein